MSTGVMMERIAETARCSLSQHRPSVFRIILRPDRRPHFQVHLPAVLSWRAMAFAGLSYVLFLSPALARSLQPYILSSPWSLGKYRCACGSS